jgi:hypothetical protein
LVVACSGDDGGSADVDGAATTTAAVRSTAEDVPLVVGQCGDVPDIDVGGPLDPAAIDEVACAQPHDVEVAAVFEHPAGRGAAFPGVDAVDGYATDQCLTRFAGYVGAPYESSALDVAFVAPGEDGWEDGDRRIACVLYHVDFAPLTGSVMGTGT